MPGFDETGAGATVSGEAVAFGAVDDPLVPGLADEDVVEAGTEGDATGVGVTVALTLPAD